MEPEHSRMARRIIRKLSESCDKFPSSLFITGVTGREEDPTFGGGYGDIYRASYNNVPVALKRLRYFIRGSELRRIRTVCYSTSGRQWLISSQEILSRSSSLERFESPTHLTLPWN
ncbi:hypothetical protein B0H16DRAFT_888357 [Mycena metata]|uniref:Uncharacterized protein n=1 Tax=Mycena metata TaxID=1033252 RepID=A0AAD7K716_9AGAR|nr:hypothetical protein B0H16DRAFT_888357 [Mycena metata]